MKLTFGVWLIFVGLLGLMGLALTLKMSEIGLPILLILGLNPFHMTGGNQASV